MYELAVATTFDHEITRVERKGNRFVATFRNLITQALVERTADQIVVEHGTRPADELYRALRQASANDGVTDLGALLALDPQPRNIRPSASFELHRVGDAVASRNVHAAILDSLRLCVAL
jgi:hypothetical protein